MDSQPSDKEVARTIAMGMAFGAEDRHRGVIIGSSPGRNGQCPCGSGKKFKKCCLPRQNGTYQREPSKLPQPRIRGDRTLTVVVDEEVIVETAASTAAPAGKNATAIAMVRAKVSRNIIWAFLETGFFITEANKAAHSPERLAKWEAALKAYDEASEQDRMIMMAPATE